MTPIRSHSTTVALVGIVAFLLLGVWLARAPGEAGDAQPDRLGDPSSTSPTSLPTAARPVGRARAEALASTSPPEPASDPCDDPLATFGRLVDTLRDLHDTAQWDILAERLDPVTRETLIDTLGKACTGMLLSDQQTAWAGIEVLWVSQLDGDIGVDQIRHVFDSLPDLGAPLLSGAAGRETVGPTAVLLTACGNWGDQRLQEYIDTAPDNLATIVGYLGFCNAPGRCLSSITAFRQHPDAEVRAASWRSVGARARIDPEALAWLKGQIEASTTADESYRGAIDGLAESALPDADLRLLENLARAGEAEAEEVRTQAALGRFTRSQDLHEGVRFLASLVDDPSLQISALSSAVLETYYGNLQVEGEEHDAWMARPKPAGYAVYSAMNPAGPCRRSPSPPSSVSLVPDAPDCRSPWIRHQQARVPAPCSRASWRSCSRPLWTC